MHVLLANEQATLWAAYLGYAKLALHYGALSDNLLPRGEVEGHCNWLC